VMAVDDGNGIIDTYERDPKFKEIYRTSGAIITDEMYYLFKYDISADK